MNFSASTSGYYITSDPTPEQQARTLVDTCLRARRQAHATYGRALLTADYSTPLEEREARYAELRADVEAAQRTLDEALDALEAWL